MVSSFNGASGRFAGRTIAVSTRVLPLGRSGAVAQLRTDLRGVLTWSKVSGPASVTVSGSGDVTLSSAIAEGGLATFRVRVQNAVGDAFERDVTLQTQANVIPVTGPTTPVITAPAFTANPSISPASANVGTTFTGIDGAMSNGGSVLSRRWLLNGTSIGSGTTVVPGAQGSLVLENTGTGNVVATSTAVTVAAAAPTPTPTPSMTIFAGAPAGTSMGSYSGAIGTVYYGDRPMTGDGYTTQIATVSGGAARAGDDF